MTKLDRRITTAGPGVSSSTTSFAYDRDGETTSVTFNGQVYAASSFDAKQRIAQVSYLGGSALGVAWDDRRGTIGSQSWSFPSSASITDEVSRSVAGRIVRERVSQGGRSFDSTYGYDAAGRLVSARIPGHELSYEFASSGGCGPNTSAGASGNRTRYVDRYTAPGASAASVMTAEYCYDWADRLLSNPVSGAVAGASQITDGVGAEEIAYDARGNMTRLSDLLLSYDADNRHVGTRTFAGVVGVGGAGWFGSCGVAVGGSGGGRSGGDVAVCVCRGGGFSVGGGDGGCGAGRVLVASGWGDG